MNNGWIKLHRKIRNKPIYQESKAVHCWIECLLRASHNSKQIYFKRKKLNLLPGMFIMGREEFGKSIGMSGSTAWYWLQRFESERMVDIKKTTKGSIVTVSKWNNYQQVDNKKTTKKQQKNSNKKLKNNKKLKKLKKERSIRKKKIEKSEIFLSSFQKDTINKFWVYLQKYHYNSYKLCVADKKRTENIWGTTLKRLLTIEKYSEEQILNAIRSAINDKFWRNQFRSIAKLRKKDNSGIKYIAKFLDLIEQNKSDVDRYLEEG